MSTNNSVLEYGHTKQRLEEDDDLQDNFRTKSQIKHKTSTSLMSIPNAVKLSMLNSGFISINKFSSAVYLLIITYREL